METWDSRDSHGVQRQHKINGVSILIVPQRRDRQRWSITQPRGVLGENPAEDRKVLRTIQRLPKWWLKIAPIPSIKRYRRS